MLGRRIAQRCRAEELLSQPNVLPVVLAPVDEFEVLMGLAAKGHSVMDLLTRFTSDREAHFNLNNFLHAVRHGDNVRFAALEEEFRRAIDATKRRLFGESGELG
jgi:hypothetical protein